MKVLYYVCNYDCITTTVSHLLQEQNVKYATDVVVLRIQSLDYVYRAVF